MAIQIDDHSQDVSRRRFLQKAGFAAAFISTGALSGKASGCISKGPEADLEKIKNLLSAKEPAVWLFTGDSITHGAKHTHGYRSYPEIFEERIKWELKRFRDVIINTGISGNTTNSILDDYEWRVAHFKPSVVSLMIGTNDCSKKEITTEVFDKNLITLLTQIRKLGAVPVFHTPNIIIKEKSAARAGIEDYVKVMRKIATENQVILVDNYAYWQDTFNNSKTENVYKDWLNDPLHPNGIGHQEIARKMFKSLSIFDPKEPSCGGAYYEGEH